MECSPKSEKRQNKQDKVLKPYNHAGGGQPGASTAASVSSYLVKIAASDPVKCERLSLTVGLHNKLMMCVSFFKTQTHIMCVDRIYPVTIGRLIELIEHLFSVLFHDVHLSF